MTLASTVSASEAEVIRVYEVALPLDEAENLSVADVGKAITLNEADSDLDPDYVDIFPISALDEFGLKGYMTEGLGIRAGALTPYEGKIARAEGYIVVVLSKAFRTKPLGLKNGHPLRLIGAFREAQAEREDVDLTSDAAQMQTPKPKKQKSQAAQSGMVATFALIFMFVFVALIVWIS
jgi:hypothetical protein